MTERAARNYTFTGNTGNNILLFKKCYYNHTYAWYSKDKPTPFLTPFLIGRVPSVYKVGYAGSNNILQNTATKKQVHKLHIPMKHHMTFYCDPHC